MAAKRHAHQPARRKPQCMPNSLIRQSCITTPVRLATRSAATGNCSQALPSNAEAHGRLGAVLMRQGKMADAISHIEHALSLRPDMFEAYGNLCQAYMWSGQRDRAIEAACRALELRETPQSKAMFAQCVGFARFAADNGRYRKFVLRALVEGWVRPRELAGVSISLIKLNGAVKDAIARADAAWPHAPTAGRAVWRRGYNRTGAG